jgi:hypothetical protein
MPVDLPPQTETVTLADTRLEQSVSVSADGFTQWRVVGSVPVVPSEELRATSSDDEREFRHWADQWLKETGHFSDPIQKFMHPAHFKIMAMGTRALPFVLREAEKMSGHWLVALNAVSPVNPVTSEDEINFQRATDAWIRWGKSQKLI